MQIPEWRESPLNRFVVELWSYQDPEMHYIIGMTEIHTYEFIRKQHSVEEFKLWSDGINVGKMYCEYSFSYGYFGYGHSNYLKNPKNPIMETGVYFHVKHKIYNLHLINIHNSLVSTQHVTQCIHASRLSLATSSTKFIASECQNN